MALHARTAAQRYSGTADWDQIARLKEAVTTVPVLGNGDIFEANDALAMMAATGCDGVVIGRGCLGRPWLFAELSAAFTGSPAPTPPSLGEVADIVRRHGSLLADHFGEDKGMRDIRKHVAWYLHGFPAGADLRRALALVKTLDELDRLLGLLDRDVPFPPAAGGPGPSGLGRFGHPARGVARRPGRLHGPGGSRRHGLGWLNRDGPEISSGSHALRLAQYDLTWLGDRWKWRTPPRAARDVGAVVSPRSGGRPWCPEIPHRGHVAQSRASTSTSGSTDPDGHMRRHHE